MNGCKRILVGFIALFFSISGCSLGGKVAEIAKNDFNRTVELADKYGKPEVKKCFSFLVAALNESEIGQGKLDELLAEDTAGIASLGLKLVLIKQFAQSLNDPVKQAAFEANFKTNCSAMAGDIFLELVKDARKAAKRLPGR